MSGYTIEKVGDGYVKFVLTQPPGSIVAEVYATSSKDVWRSRVWGLGLDDQDFKGEDSKAVAIRETISLLREHGYEEKK